MAFQSLGETINMLRATGRLTEIEQTVSPRYEGAACLSRAAKLGLGPVLFRSLEGHDLLAVGNLICSEEILALDMGLEAGAPIDAVLAERLRTPVPTKRVERLPVEEVDGSRKAIAELLPVFTYFEGDSGPFITSGLLQSVDPESAEVVRGIHRMELRGDRELGVALLNPPMADVYRKYKEAGRPMPMAVVIGMPPLVFTSFAFKSTPGTDKLAVAGGLRGEAVEVGLARETGIEVPAQAEFLLEGYVDPSSERPDGPMGEIGGYYQTFPKTPSFTVTRITHREAPVYHALLPHGPEGDLLLRKVTQAFVLSQVGDSSPMLDALHFVPTTFGSSLVVRLKPGERETVRELLVELLSMGGVKKVVAVADDVDPTDHEEVEWSLATRFRPDEDTIIRSGLKGSPIDPSCEENFLSAKVAFDATGYGLAARHQRAKLQPGAAEIAAALLSRS